MIAFSDQFTRMFLLIVNGLFIATGVGMMALGIYQNVAVGKLQDDADDTPSGSVTIVTGCFEIAVGVCGLVGALLNKRILLMVNVGLLATAIVSNLVVLIVYAVVLSSVTTSSRTIMKTLISKKYGNMSDPEAKKFTQEVNDYHTNETCCGWSGVSGENIYKDTPWYRENNANARLIGSSAALTLPDSCCIQTTDGCHRAIDITEARRNGFVYKMDCIEKIVGRAYITGAIFLTQASFTTILQIACVAFSVLFLKQQPAAE